MKRTITLAMFMLSMMGCSHSLTSKVPIVRESEGVSPELFAQATKLRASGRLLAMDEVKKQLGKSYCRLTLPAPKRQPLSGSEIWNLARNAHVRVGYFFLCNKCNKWHLNIAGGYAITADGAVATCFHVVEPKEMKEGYLLATTEAGTVLPVAKVLAADKFTDICIVRVESPVALQPLPLNPDITPGADVWCYSDPADRPGFFTKGIVNRFYQHWHGSRAKEKFPIRMNVSTDWAPGSSGAAVLDQFGNAVGHVVTISARSDHTPSGATSRPGNGETVIVFHDAVRAVDVLTLIKH